MFDLAYRELVAVPRALGSPRPVDGGLSARTALVVGNFGPKVEYFPFEQGFRTLRRCLTKPAVDGQ